ncbi:MAG: hypothetical protein JF599_00180, partial [Verrucomicrobia bacterium]|nr:hypothetical protein [Verrucomicrobiota bacterium]
MPCLPLLGASACPESSSSRLNGGYFPHLAVRRPQPAGSRPRRLSWLPALLLAVLGWVAWASPVRAEDVDVYLFAGQSNMWGTGTHLSDLPANLQGPRTGIWILNKPPQVSAVGWYPLNNGVNNNWDGDSWGAEAQLT